LRVELWVVLDAWAKIELGHRVIQPQLGDRIFIPRISTHRLSVTGDTLVRILEISFGEFEENDIVCLEDVYRRVASAADALSTQSVL
jgi:mannose-6-phosphate isomerase